MKLGLYGGGFKPFHTGHFAKLLLALDEVGEEGKVISFFGIKKQKFSDKTGKPLKTKFRKFGDGPDARPFNQEMQEEIVSIYEDALENAFPGKLDIVPSADEPPLTKIFNVLNSFAYQNMSEEERQNLPEDIPQASGGQNLKDFDMSNIEEIIVVAGSDEVDKTYIAGIDRQAEKSEIGKKIKELINSGKIRFETGAADQQRLVDLLGRYREGASEDHVLVRGTDVRNYAANKDVDSLLRYIPSVVGEKEREQIVKILIGDKSQNESFLMPIITDSTVLRAAVKFTAQKEIKESKSKRKGEDHILGLTEDMSLTFENLKGMIDDVLSGRVDHVEEKMDGQNFTFTVLNNGQLRVFGKGVSATTLERGGKNREAIKETYANNEKVRDAFLSAYDVTQDYLLGKDSDLVKNLFQGGKVVIEGQIMTPINPNTIPYTENHVRFVRPFTPYDDIKIDLESYRDVFEDQDIEIDDRNGRPWSFGPVPKLAQTESDASEIKSKIDELKSDVDALVAGFSRPPTTVGDYASQVLDSYIKDNIPDLDLSSLSDEQRSRAMQRLATGAKGLIGKKEIGTSWPEFQKFEKLRTAHVAAAIVDLEKIVQKLGTYFFDTLEFALATNDDVVSDLAAEVDKIKAARAADNISIKNVETGEISDLVDTSWATKLDSSLTRVEQMGLFKKAVEGVVLRMQDPDGNEIVRKLTGMFTPIHRLVSLFKYPDRYSGEMLVVSQDQSEDLTDQEVDVLNELLVTFASKLGLEHIILEGGASFKNMENENLTTEIDLENVQPTLDHFFQNHLKPAGIEFYGKLGSTGKKSKSGDLDIVVPAPTDDKKEIVSFKKNLLDAINVSMEDGSAKLVGQNIGVMYPIQGGQSGEYVQVDVMIDPCPEDTCWLMSGTGDGGIKGVYRNLMLSYIANRRTREGDPSIKYAISFPGGLQIKSMPEGLDPEDPKNKRKWQAAGQKITSPAEILSTLGINADPKDIETFKELVDFMNLDPDLSQYLEGFEEYITRYLSSESTSREATRAVSYISSVLSDSRNQQGETIEESLIRRLVRKILSEGSGSTSEFAFTKTKWSEKLKIFSAGKWNLWNERVSATADGGKDPEGAEKAVAAMENLIYLGQNGYAVIGQDDGGVLVQGKGINAKLDPDEAVEYIIGIRTSQDENEPVLPNVKIRHVAGTKPYDLELAADGTALEVKKMGGKDKLSKLGSATGRIFDRNVKIIRPLRNAGQVAQKFIETGLVIGEDGSALIRAINSPPEDLNVDEVASAVEMIDYFFNKIRFGRSEKELPGVMIKVEGGQIGAGMARRMKRGDLLNIEDRGNIFDVCKKALNSTLGDYSPGKERDKTSDEDGVDIKAATGQAEYEGKVSLDYFYDELIYRLFDSDEDGRAIDESLLTSYAQSLELLSEIYPLLAKINSNQGEDIFDEFISDLHYGGFYGVNAEEYYSVPCDPQHLDVYGTTQGFRAVLAMKSIPPEGPSIPEVSVKNPAEEQEVDLEVDLQPEDKGSETPSDQQDVEQPSEAPQDLGGEGESEEQESESEQAT